LPTILKKIGEWATIGFGAVVGVAFAGFLAGALTIFMVRSLAPGFPWEAVTPPAHNIGDWRSLVVIAIGCLAILCVFLIWSLVSPPLGKLIEKSFAKWDAAVSRERVPKWIGQFILSKPSREEIQAAQNWADKNKEFDERIMRGDYSGHSEKFEAETYAITQQKKALPSYPWLKKASNIRAYLLGIPICFLFVWAIHFANLNHSDADDQETADNPEAVDDTASVQSFENPSEHWVVEYQLGLLRRWLVALGN
jgi:hypothetical protein